jgi:predicted RNA-binding Zn-ribbon protein involved in translation (DUF1610 family)
MRYDDQALRDAARAAYDMTDMLLALGLEDTAQRRRHYRARLARAGADTSHWAVSSRHRYSSADLAKAVRLSTSVAGVLRELGIKQAGGSQNYIAGRIRREGLDTSHFTGQRHMLGKPGRSRCPQDVLVLLPPGGHRTKRPVLQRAMVGVGVPYRCAECGTGPEWRGRELVLVIDHVNGEWLDNRIGNVRFLCPNCHAQTATWCRRKGP